MRTLKDLLVPATVPSAALKKAGDTLIGALNSATHATIASASSIDIGAASSNSVTITGTTAITSLGTIADGAVRTLTFTEALVLTYNSTSLILPTGSNIATEAGDTADFISLGGGNWKCSFYQRASGAPVGGYPVQLIVGTTQLAVKNFHYVITNVAATEVTTPAVPAEGDIVVVTVDNGLITNTMNFNGKNHEQSTDPTMTIDSGRATLTWRFLNNKWRLI